MRTSYKFFKQIIKYTPDATGSPSTDTDVDTSLPEARTATAAFQEHQGPHTQAKPFSSHHTAYLLQQETSSEQ
jgi:hypothetical protein